MTVVRMHHLARPMFACHDDCQACGNQTQKPVEAQQRRVWSLQAPENAHWSTS